MGLHRNARLGLAGRHALVRDVEAGRSCREAARRRGVSPTTACKWWQRWRRTSAAERSSLACLQDRPSRPRRSPRLLPVAEQARICAARRRSTYTHNRGLAELLGRSGIRHLLIPYRRPQVNGKVERYQQTLKREWALGQVHRSSEHRARAL
jgi:hypothetical protein